MLHINILQLSVISNNCTATNLCIDFQMGVHIGAHSDYIILLSSLNINSDIPGMDEVIWQYIIIYFCDNDHFYSYLVTKILV